MLGLWRAPWRRPSRARRPSHRPASSAYHSRSPTSLAAVHPSARPTPREGPGSWDLVGAAPAPAATTAKCLELIQLVLLVVVMGLWSSGLGEPFHPPLAGGLFCGAAATRWARLARTAHEAVAVASVFLVLVLSVVALHVGRDLGAHLLLLPLAVLQQRMSAGCRACGACAAVGLVFLAFEVADLEPDVEHEMPAAVRILNRVVVLLSLSLVVMSLRQEHGELSGKLAATRASHDKLESAAQAKMSFLTMMSHEIRTPLNAVIAFSDMLCAALKDDKEHGDMAETVRSSSQALLAIINDVLDFSRVDEGQLTLTPALVELDEVVDDTLAALHATASVKGLTLCADVQLPLPCTVEVDAVRLRQVLTNLVGNALKFTEQGHVLLTVSAKNGEFEFAVSDTGCGIPREALATVFEPYQQADQRLVRTHDGTGLGLAICSRIAAAMGGALAVDSEPGKGSTFRLLVPLAVQNPNPPPQAAEETKNPEDCINIEVTSPVLQLALRSAVSRIPNTPPGPPVVVTDDPQRTGERVIFVADPLHPVETPHQHRRLLLPVRRAALREALTGSTSPEALEPDSPPPPPSMLRLDVLVAEDNTVNRKVVGHMLKRLGCLARMAVNGRECVEQFKERRPDVVLMDCHMPVMDGFEAARAIRELDPTVPIFALTADALEAANTAALESGMNRVLTKPIVVGTLRAALDTVAAATDAPKATSSARLPEAVPPAADRLAATRSAKLLPPLATV